MKASERTVGVLVLAAALAGGYAAGRASGAPEPGVPAAASECRAVPAEAGLAPERIAELVRTAVRAELAPLGAAARTADPAAALPNARSSAVPAVHRVASPRAVEAAEHLLDDALAAGRWEAEDQAELRRVLGQLDPARETALLQRLAAALNSGELQIGFDGPMF